MNCSIEKTIRRHCARRLPVYTCAALLVVSGCSSGFDPFSNAENPIVLAPINGVVVYGEQVAVGDTVRVFAEGFHDGDGSSIELLRSVAFSVSDSTVANLDAVRWTPSTMPSVRVRGLRDGVVTVYAVLNGVTGHGSMRVILAGQSIHAARRSAVQLRDPEGRAHR